MKRKIAAEAAELAGGEQPLNIQRLTLNAQRRDVPWLILGWKLERSAWSVGRFSTGAHFFSASLRAFVSASSASNSGCPRSLSHHGSSGTVL